MSPLLSVQCAAGVIDAPLFTRLHCFFFQLKDHWNNGRVGYVIHIERSQIRLFNFDAFVTTRSLRSSIHCGTRHIHSDGKSLFVVHLTIFRVHSGSYDRKSLSNQLVAARAVLTMDATYCSAAVYARAVSEHRSVPRAICFDSL